ncbi:HAD family hydrolase [Pseudomonas viridiflava]|uniref:HAD family hydrolase n=1 Tax=Pseudomonas viridiflava TaxID=33069 RepID=UPI000F026B6C|nr:HAD-IA family hydrolase [Pseudomonas viridiflava]
MPIVAAVFDAFGTVVHIGRKRHPFRQLLRIGAEQGRRPGAADLKTLMTSSLSLEAAADYFGIRLSAQQMMSLQNDLEAELVSITPYPDALEALQLLKADGVAIGICSNLALPYGPVLRDLFGEVDGFALSYELGFMKPNPDIYREICNRLHVSPAWDMTSSGDRVVMIGDSVQCDQMGPRVVGISGYHLDRKGSGPIRSLRQFAELVIEDRRNGFVEPLQ